MVQLSGSVPLVCKCSEWLRRQSNRRAARATQGGSIQRQNTIRKESREFSMGVGEESA